MHRFYKFRNLFEPKGAAELPADASDADENEEEVEQSSQHSDGDNGVEFPGDEDSSGDSSRSSATRPLDLISQNISPALATPITSAVPATILVALFVFVRYVLRQY